jgi:predicted sulfurtransferase
MYHPDIYMRSNNTFAMGYCVNKNITDLKKIKKYIVKLTIQMLDQWLAKYGRRINSAPWYVSVLKTNVCFLDFLNNYSINLQNKNINYS